MRKASTSAPKKLSQTTRAAAATSKTRKVAVEMPEAKKTTSRPSSKRNAIAIKLRGSSSKPAVKKTSNKVA